LDFHIAGDIGGGLTSASWTPQSFRTPQLNLSLKKSSNYTHVITRSIVTSYNFSDIISNSCN